MLDIYITFRSLTAAQRGQEACLARGISVGLIRAPQILSTRGCGYALVVSSAVASQISLILRLERIPFEHAYRLTAAGAEEIAI